MPPLDTLRLARKFCSVPRLLSCLAILLFLGQGITGTRDLLEVPLSWQEPYVQKLYEQQCEMKPCTIRCLQFLKHLS
jgi:hypothetical protein